MWTNQLKEKVISIFNFNFNISNSLFVFEGSPTTTNGGGGAWHRGARGCQREGNPLGERRPPGGRSLILLPLNLGSSVGESESVKERVNEPVLESWWPEFMLVGFST